MYVRTNNNALTHSPNSGRVLLFFRAARDTSEEELNRFILSSWDENPEDTLKLIFHLRNCRGGKGEKRQGINSVKWLQKHAPHTFSDNIKYLPEYGYYKDLLSFLGTNQLITHGSDEKNILKLLCNQLNKDWKLFNEGDKNSISLVSKWIPSEGCSHDKKYNTTKKFCYILGINRKEFRQRLSLLRNHLNVVEKKMCLKEWDDIDFSKIPSVALHRYAKSFQKHTPQLYQDFLNKVNKGEVKMNTARLQPHEIVSPYILQCFIDNDVETRWKQYKKQLKERIGLKNILPVIDVSGSMYGGCGKVKPIDVSLSLGLIVSDLSEGRFHNKWINFSSRPSLKDISGDTLRQQLDNLKNDTDWGMNTNYEAVYDLILNVAETFGLTQSQLPDAVLVLSDMQFDQCSTGNFDRERTNDQAIKQKFKAKGYIPPKRIYWNLAAAKVDFPVKSFELNTALVSGFSPDLLELFLETGDISPFDIMKKAINNPLYDKLKVNPKDL